MYPVSCVIREGIFLKIADFMLRKEKREGMDVSNKGGGSHKGGFRTPERETTNGERSIAHQKLIGKSEKKN